MPRYFLHLRYGPDRLAVDEEGDELAHARELCAHVEQAARDLMRNARLGAIPDWRRCVFEVADEAGVVVMTLPFADVAPRSRG